MLVCVFGNVSDILGLQNSLDRCCSSNSLVKSIGETSQNKSINTAGNFCLCHENVKKVSIFSPSIEPGKHWQSVHSNDSNRIFYKTLYIYHIISSNVIWFYHHIRELRTVFLCVITNFWLTVDQKFDTLS